VDPLDEQHSELLSRYVQAFERYDMEALVSLLHEDATQNMPPFEMWLQGPRPRHPVDARPGCRLPWVATAGDHRPTDVLRSPNTGQWAPTGARAVGSAGAGDLRRSHRRITSFLDTDLFPCWASRRLDD
jgi:RNA polymerase sigma-70 factor (ECF subfamily)